MTGVLTAEDLTKEIGGEPVLRGIDLMVEAGEIAVLMGPNGVGKTILLCSLSGGLSYESGSVVIAGEAEPTKSLLNLLVQKALAIEQLTGRENARFYSRLHPESTGEWPEYCRRLGLDGELDKEVRHYSGGMRRKLELAITLDVDVPLYLLDEPTAGLDLAIIGRVHELLVSERDRGKAILLSSHTPLDMEIADRVLFLRDGRITAADSPEILLEDLPAVVRIRGNIGRLQNQVATLFVGNRYFDRGDEVRGFLKADVGIGELNERIQPLQEVLEVTTEQPSYVDLFNYQRSFGNLRGEAR